MPRLPERLAPTLPRRRHRGDPGRRGAAPGLLPAPRYAADHGGVKPTVDAAGEARCARPAPPGRCGLRLRLAGSGHPPVNAPKLRWIQATSAGIGAFMSRTRTSTHPGSS